MSTTEGESNDPRARNDEIGMETPPSSPPQSSRKPGGTSKKAKAGHDDPLTLTDTITQSLSLSPESTAREPRDTKETGSFHRRSTTPSTPVSDEALGDIHQGSGTTAGTAPAPRQQGQQFSTPGRGGSGSFGGNEFPGGKVPRASGGSNLTGVFTPSRGRSGSFGGNEFPGSKVPGVSGRGTVLGASGGFQGAPISELTPVISNSGAYADARLSLSDMKPGMPGLPPDPDESGVQEGGASRSSSGGSGVDGVSSRGLRQRRLPLPRAGLPPAKRSSLEGGTKESAPKPFSQLTTLSAIGASLSTSPSHMTSEDSYENLGNLLGERLSMPSYSDDGSSVDTSGSGPGFARMSSAATGTMTLGRPASIKNTGAMTLGGAASIFQNQDRVNLAAPIELEPDRKFFSFQGVNQYKQHVAAATKGVEGGTMEESTPPRLEAILSPSRRPPASPKKQRQYRPMLRSQHGVKEMADAQDLDAIFKAPRKAPAKVVTPFASPMHLDPKQPPLSPSHAKKDDSCEELLAQPYPVESQWSIPSIRLANHVNQTSSSERPNESFASYADCSEYTDDESFYSFLEDDDASLSSRGSLDASARRRKRISGIFQLQRKASEGAASGGKVPHTIPSWDATEELVEAIASRGLSIGSPLNSFTAGPADTAVSNAKSMNDADIALPPALTRRANTFDSEARPPVFDIAAVATVDDAADEYRSRRRRGGKGGRRRRREGEAVEWLRGLKDKSRGDMSLAEAASSRFLGAGFGGGGVASDVRAKAGRPDNMTQVLGIPHPLCRSSTIGPGLFVPRAGGAFGSGNGEAAGGMLLRDGNSVALTSSGSGD